MKDETEGLGFQVSGFGFRVKSKDQRPKYKDQVRRQKAAGSRQAAAGRRLSPDLNERIPSRNSLNCCRDLKARNSLLSPLQGDESLWDVIQGCVPGQVGTYPWVRSLRCSAAKIRQREAEGRTSRS